MPVASLANLPPAPAGERRGRAYLRFTVADRPGVLAELTAAMRDANVSIESMIQRGSGGDGPVLLAMVTHSGPERCVADALARLEGSPSLTAKPMLMHILDL
jgi:homoserine dehydrogenase